jgi:hypothetical protein
VEKPPSEEFRRDAERVNSRGTVNVEAWDPYRRGEFEKCIEVLERRRHPDALGDVQRAYALAELPDGPAHALEAYRKMAKLYTAGRGPLYWHTVPLLLGRKRDVVDAARELRRQGYPSSRLLSDFHERWLAFNADEISEDGFLEKAGDSKNKQCWAHYAIGMMRLAEGNRVGAKNHFRTALSTNAFSMFAYECCRSFLDRMEHDPKWPPWIPAKD